MRTINLSAAAAVLAFSTLTSAAAATTAITVKGNAFFRGNERFYIRGVDYQPGGSSNLGDPLANTTSCSRDIPIMQELGINTLRVYTVDNSENHDECMKMLEDAGIYLILDVNTPNFSINREFPMYSYNANYLQHVFATIDVFGQYTNTLGFFSANEVTNMVNNTRAATIVKAVTRDMKQYIADQVNRPIPVGYSAADVAENRMQMAQYLDCGDDDMARGDFYAINDYSWCGSKSSFQISGWDQKVQNYTDYAVPIFLSEFGCNAPSPRVFAEIESLYSTDMTGVFSGGLVYEFTQETNNYGLVQVSGDGKTVEKLTDFDNLAKMYNATANPTGDGGYQTGLPAKSCPAATDVWQASNTLPNLPADASTYMKSGAGKALGNSGGSQYIPPSGTEDLSFSGDTSTASGSASASSGTASAGAALGNSEMVAGTWWIGVIVPMAAVAGAMFVF
ncbi:uncharacterized protein H6S33_002414 [Morchella sextelata]|uniref:uncharacterized protein n=1 Tax=Morchella sextelata TaxID=1174677 RepID=UPI001D050860|nr:uncharacterized protein H6S33_002414 [Morchella sextelata]KAH0607380.1 hypothetical protein H6S33_002414 [Morchella sextelata]